MEEILIYATFTVLVAIIILGGANFEKLTSPMIILFILVVLSFLTDLASVIMNRNELPTMWLINIYAIVEFALLSSIYYILFKTHNYRKIIGIGLLISLITIIVLTLNHSNAYEFNDLVTGIESIIFILLAVGYFRLLLKELEFETPLENPIFWINSGVLIYFSGAFFFFIFSSAASQVNHIKIWMIHNLIHLIYTILILIAFWKTRKA